MGKTNKITTKNPEKSSFISAIVKNSSTPATPNPIKMNFTPLFMSQIHVSVYVPFWRWMMKNEPLPEPWEPQSLQTPLVEVVENLHKKRYYKKTAISKNI